MSLQPPSLVDQIASLRASAEADAAGKPAPGEWPWEHILQALIMAAFAAILARLENLVRLWTAGLLPVPAPRAPKLPEPRAAVARHPRRTGGAGGLPPQRRSPTTAAAPQPMIERRAPAPVLTARVALVPAAANPGSTRMSPRVRRLAPAARPPIAFFAAPSPLPTCAQFVPFTKLYSIPALSGEPGSK